MQNIGNVKMTMLYQELVSSYQNDDASKIKKIAESINQRW